MEEVGDQIEARTCLYSEKRMVKEEEEEKDDEGTRLIECLRGRLLAERQASRAAKEEAELVGKRLGELERRLREDIELRDKAEKKRKFLKKKLGRFEAPPLMERDQGNPLGALEVLTDHPPSTASSGAQEANPERAVPLHDTIRHNVLHISGKNVESSRLITQQIIRRSG